jgi:DNA replication ATP-dependent helicase Dna2
MVDGFVGLGLEARRLSIISPYRPQLRWLVFPGHDEVEVSTIDKYQGRDRECVIISLVRSNLHGSIGELLKDWQRLNVAFTRAKKKLVLVGSARTVLNESSFRPLKSLLSERNWICALPPDSLNHALIS